MNAPERITVTVDRHGEPIVFGAAEGDGCSVAEYVRVDLIRQALNGAPLDEHGHFINSRYETIYRATGDSPV